MTIQVHVEPGAKYSWDQFIKEKGPYSMALDGIVMGATIRIPDLPAVNLDHHADVDRISTRSTSEQVAMEINLGMMQMFQKDGLPHANLYINDVDEDCCLATWLIKRHELVINHANPKINRLVYCQDKLDCTAGMYPFGNTEFRRQLAWIMHPYQNARYNGKLHNMTASDMTTVLEAVHARIERYIFDKPEEIEIKGDFKILKQGTGWAIVEEYGPAARMALLDAGIDAFLVKRHVDGNKYHYSIGRRSVWVPFDVLGILAELSKHEPDGVEWGGANTIGGSPREHGSILTPDQIFDIIEKKINGQN